MAGEAGRLEQITSSIDELAEKLLLIEQIPTKNRQLLFEAALEPIKPKIIKMLVQNYNASGLQTRTGTLLANIKKSRIWVFMQGKSKNAVPKIALRLPTTANVSKYKDGKVDKPYIVANSQHFGAVHTPREKREIIDLGKKTSRIGKASIIGQDKKRTIKKKVLGYAVTNKAAESIARSRTIKNVPKLKGRKFEQGVQIDFGSAQREGRKSTINVSYNSKGEPVKSSKLLGEDNKAQMVIIDALPFYYLTGDQLKQIGNEMQRNVMEIIGG